MSKPGARSLVASWPPSERVPLFKALFDAMKAELPEARIGEAPTALGTSGEMVAEMTAAGFRTVDVHEHIVVPGMATPAELWRSFSRGGAPAVLMRRKMGEEAFAGFSQRIVARLEAALGAGPMEVRLTALLGVGTR